MRRHGIHATRLSACTPDTPEVAALLAVESHEDLRLLPGMTASGVSHFQIWRQCAAQPEGDDSATLVMEDDVMLLRRWRAELTQCLRKAPDDWELLTWTRGRGLLLALPLNCGASQRSFFLPKTAFLGLFIRPTPRAGCWLGRLRPTPAARNSADRAAAARPLLAHAA